jgi:nucleotide-binding universal stress UspA family protein
LGCHARRENPKFPVVTGFYPATLRVTMEGARFRHITVAIDGSPHGAAALDCAIDLAKRYSSELEVISVAPIAPVYVPSNEPYVPATMPDGELPRYREVVEAGVRASKEAGVASVSGICEQGVVADEILARLERHPTDLLVVGSRGRSAARRILLGSVSTAMVTHAPCPVLVVRTAPTPGSG